MNVPAALNLWLAIPWEVRLATLFVLGVMAGALANVAIYRLAWHCRPIDPWFAPAPEAPPRRWWDRIPIVGWWGLRREAALHGTGFWLRPMAVELFFGVALAGLYAWEVGRMGLVHPLAPAWVGQANLHWLHAQFLAHAVVLWLVVTTSLIDIDEKTIPDALTVPGTLAGLILAATIPFALLPVPWRAWGPQGAQQIDFGFLTVVSPHVWRGWVQDLSRPSLLGAGLACWWLWCVALLHRTWYSRHGWCRAAALMLARLARSPSTPRILLMGAVGTLAIVAVWRQGGWHWVGLLSSLVGMAGGAAVVWIVRVLGTLALRREAMGFGDVTLMAALGTFLGWQGALMVFFLAPLAGIAIGVPTVLISRDSEIPYGPYLCLAAAAVIVFWARLWMVLEPHFLVLGVWIPVVVGVCLALLPVILVLLRLGRKVVAGVLAARQ